MRPLVGGAGNEALVYALHVILTIPPLVNYLNSRLLEEDLSRKRVNAVAFAHGLSRVAKEYWDDGAVAPVDAGEPLAAFRRIHRAAHIPAPSAVRLMFQSLQDAVHTAGNLLAELGGTWLTLEPDSPCESVQQLLNSASMTGSPELVFVRLDRGERTRRFVNYGTVLKHVIVDPKEVHTNVYELFSVLTEGDGDCRVYARKAETWADASSDAVVPLANINDLITYQAQVLVYLLRP